MSLTLRMKAAPRVAHFHAILDPMPIPSTPGEHALALAVAEIEEFAARFGWDGPVLVFSLVRTHEAAAADPSFAAQLTPAELQAAPADHLTPVQQEDLPAADSIEELLARLAWPEAVAGAAVVVERVIQAHDGEVALASGSHPEREVRLAVGVLRDGTDWTVLRMRAHDRAADRAQGPGLVPGLAEALTATFDPLPE